MSTGAAPALAESDLEVPALAWETPRAWAAAVLCAPDALLVDHAHCELGAAATAQALIARHPEHGALVDRLARLATEELRHFGRVHRLLRARGVVLPPPPPNPYAAGLVRRVDRGAPEALLDRLLVAALIERRSHERFALLAEVARADHPDLAELAVLFGDLLASERGHARLFVDLAAELHTAAAVAARLAHWTAREGALVSTLPFAPRIHSGPPTDAAG